MRRAAALITLIVAAAGSPGVASADSTWTRVSSIARANVDNELHMVAVGPRVVGSWTIQENGKLSVELVAFDPSRAADAANLVTAITPIAREWAFLDSTLVATPSGGAELVVGGAKVGDFTDPTAGTSTAAVNSADTGVGPLIRQTAVQSGGMLAGIYLSSAAPLFAWNRASTLFLSRPGAEEFLQVTGSATTPLPFCCGYQPALGRDAAGRYWLAFYSNSTAHVGVYVGQLDPATGALLGPLAKAPASETPSNNGATTPLACAATCRVVYLGTRPDGLLDGRLLSWAAGEAAPAVVVNGLTTTGRAAAAYRPDGRLWVAWDGDDAKGDLFFAKLGDSTGAGGTAMTAGRPPLVAGGSGDLALTALPIGNDLLLATQWLYGNVSSYAQYVNLVPEPSLITDGIPSPQVVASPGGKIAYPTRVGAAEAAKGCLPVRAVADKPARIWAAIWTGSARNTGARLSSRVLMRFAKAGSKRVCLRIPKRAAGGYRGKPFRIVFEVRTGFSAKPSERNRPPWRTQPRLVIDA